MEKFKKTKEWHQGAHKTLVESIEHWKKMIQWASKQNLDEKDSRSWMGNQLGENWSGEHCPCCQKFGDCIGCPIFIKTGSKECRGTPWVLITNAGCGSWGEWLKYAIDELAFLQNLEKEYKEKLDNWAKDIFEKEFS